MADLLQKLRLFQGLCTGDRACTGPFYVTLDVTRRCNLRCLGCRFHSEDAGGAVIGDPDVRDLPFEWAEGLFSELRRLNTRTLFFMGEGEPFLHPRIFDLIRLAKRFGLRTTITTNGTLIDERRAVAILESGLDEMHVSLWTSSIDAYERQYPGTDPANFARVIDGVRTLSSLKAESRSRAPYIVLSNPINRLNYQGVDDMAALAERTGFDAVSFTPFKTNRGRMHRYALTAGEQAEHCRDLERLRERLRALPLGENTDRTLARYRYNAAVNDHLCYICWYHSRIKVDGTVFPCGRSERALGNLANNTFSEIWNGEAYRLERKRMLSSEGFAYRNRVCDCEHCSYVQDNLAIHRRFRYLLPILSRVRNDTEDRRPNKDFD